MKHLYPFKGIWEDLFGLSDIELSATTLKNEVSLALLGFKI
jgi:hypothetical protein